jgi:hypothetical protein
VKPSVSLRKCTHEGDEPVVIEGHALNEYWGQSVRCPRCGFRTMSMYDDNGNDITDQHVSVVAHTTWAEWEATP